MFKRTVTSWVLTTITNRRLFSLRSLSNRQYPSRQMDENKPEVNNQHRPFARFHERSSNPKSRAQKYNKDNASKGDLDDMKPRFNRYNVVGPSSKPSTPKKPIDDDDNNLFTEETYDLTMLGVDRSTFASSSNKPAQKPTTTAVSVSKKPETWNIPLEVLIQPDLRDLYSDETIHQSLETHISEMSPALRPFTFDLAYLINESATLKRFVNMGVDVYRWNQPIDKGKYVLTLDFERDCLQHLAFLNELGIKNKQLAEFLTFNPWIFKESLEDLRVRIDYLSSKGFSPDDLQEICTRAPYLLNLSTKTIDTKFKWFQNKFHLSEIQLKDFVLRAPKLLTLPLKGISNTYFNMNQQLAFEHEELHQIFHVYPKLFIYDYKLIELNFDFLFNEMQMPRSSFVQYPPILKQSFQQLRTRCLYLKYLKRQQFDPSKPNFVSLKDLCLKTNELFCQHVAKTSLQQYLKFMKTL